MTTSAKLAGVVLLAGLALLRGPAPASAGDTLVRHVEPLKGIMLAVGSKRAVGYYTSSGDACNLTLLLADAYSETANNTPSEPIRVKLTVREGTSAQVDALEGSLAFSCAAGATAMEIQPVERVAFNAAAK